MAHNFYETQFNMELLKTRYMVLIYICSFANSKIQFSTNLIKQTFCLKNKGEGESALKRWEVLFWLKERK